MVFDFLTAHTAKCLVALQAILWICNEVETDRTRQCLFEELIRVSDIFTFIVPGRIVLFKGAEDWALYQSFIGEVARPLHDTARLDDEHGKLVLHQCPLLQLVGVVFRCESYHCE